MNSPASKDVFAKWRRPTGLAGRVDGKTVPSPQTIGSEKIDSSIGISPHAAKPRGKLRACDVLSDTTPPTRLQSIRSRHR